MSKKKVSKKEFALIAIEALLQPYTNKQGETVTPKGIHSVYSKVEGANFNEMWRDYFGDDPIAGIKALVEQGVIETHPAKGGAMIYRKGEMPTGAGRDTKKALAKLGIA